MLQVARRSRGVIGMLGTRVMGVAFLLVLALLIGLAVAAFHKVFTPVVDVQLQTDSIGNQLQNSSDVKVRGLLVGEVRDISSSGTRATMTLALNPDYVDLIPENVQARLLPKTLFGEKYVSLVIPDHPAAQHIRGGDVITQDRSSTAIELEKVFDDLLPVLQAVKPQNLAITLNALATALEGRGEALGHNLVLVNQYFSQLNPRMPTIQADISLLADVASMYADAAPDLLRLARNFAFSSQTLVAKQASYAGFLAGTAAFANTATTVLSENEQRIVRLGQVSKPTLAVLAKYAPEYPCLLQGLADYVPRIDQAFQNGALHITLETVPQRPGYQPGQYPQWLDRRGPNCYGLPNPPGNQAHPYPGQHFADGTGGSSGSAGSALPGSLLIDPSSGYAGSPGEKAVMSALLAPSMNTTADRVPDLATLLFGPMARGQQVGQQ